LCLSSSQRRRNAATTAVLPSAKGVSGVQQHARFKVTDGASCWSASRLDDARRGALAVFASRELGDYRLYARLMSSRDLAPLTRASVTTSMTSSTLT
jgi:hypothetical protein